MPILLRDDLQGFFSEALYEGVAVDGSPAQGGREVYPAYARLPEGGRDARSVGTVDVAVGGKGGFRVVARLVRARHVDAVVEGAGGAREIVLETPRLAPGGGNQDQVCATERGLPDHLGETYVPADGERDAQPPGVDYPGLGTRREDEVLLGRPHQVALAIGGDHALRTHEVRTVEDAGGGPGDPLGETVRDVDTDLPGEGGEEPGALAPLGVLRVEVGELQGRVGAGKELGQDHVAQRRLDGEGRPDLSLCQEEVAFHVTRLRAQVQRRHGGDAGQGAIEAFATGEYSLDNLRH